MPVYICITAPKTLAEHTKAALAAEITKIHSSITGAPTSFVHVVFQELPATNLFTVAASAPAAVSASTRTHTAKETTP